MVLRKMPKNPDINISLWRVQELTYNVTASHLAWGVHISTLQAIYILEDVECAHLYYMIIMA